MAQLSIRVTFPLGTFLGHRDVGHRADFPDTARLFSALVNAAGQGSTAVDVDGHLGLCPESVEALRWLEEHPPAAVTLPDTRPAVGLSALSWRADGVRGKKGLKKQLKRQSDAVAVSGSFGWSWAEDVPAEMVEVIDALCADISCLGEADSPVVVDLVPVQPTHELAIGQRLPSARRHAHPHGSTRPARRPHTRP
jgi:CRISPR-associated protein Csb2